MRPPSEYIAPFDEDRQTGLVQTLPAGGIVTVGVGAAVVAVEDRVALDDAVAEWDIEAVAEWLAELDAEAVVEWLADAEAVAEWPAELDAEAVAEWLADAEAVAEWPAELEADDGGGFVAEADALVVLVGGVAPLLSIVKVARRTELARYGHALCDHIRTAVIVCCPSGSLVVSKGRAEPSRAVPPKSNGGTTSVRTGRRFCHESST
jgi:hypothetical protein